MPKRYEKCSQCGERWAEDMLWRTGRVAVCWPCMQKHERALENRRRSKLPNGPGDDIGSWIFKIALIGLIVGAIVIAFFMSQKKHSVPPPKNPLATPALRR